MQHFPDFCYYESETLNITLRPFLIVPEIRNIFFRYSVMILKYFGSRDICWYSLTKSVTEYFFHNISCFGDDKVRFYKKLTRNIAIFRFLGNDNMFFKTIDKCRHPEKRRKSDSFPSLFTFRFFRHFSYMGGVKEWPKKRSDFRAPRNSLKFQNFNFFQKCRNQKIMKGQFSWHPSIIFFFMQRIPTAFVILPTVFLYFKP